MKRIKLTIEEAGGVDRRDWPVTTGVPFADGELEQADLVCVVTDTGKRLPTQTSCLTTWDKDGRHVKWLLLDFQIDLQAGQKRDLYLEYGSGGQVINADVSVTCERLSGLTRIDTGAMQVDLSHGRADFLSAIRVRTTGGWRDLLVQRPGFYLYMADQHGESYDSYRAAPPPTIEVEDEGPLRASVCIKGFHASSDGRRFCPYVLRMHFYTGRTDIRVFHTFIFDQDPERIELTEVGLRLDLQTGEEATMFFGADQPDEFSAPGRMLQVSDLEYRVEHGDDQVSAIGEKTRGWASICANQGAAMAVIRDIWQEYPKAIGLDEGGFDIQIWPRGNGETLQFSTPFKKVAVRFGATRAEGEFKRLIDEHPGAPLNLKSLNISTANDHRWVEQMVAKYASDRAVSYNDTGTGNGFGAAKTTELLWRFSAESITVESADELAAAVQEPLIATVDTGYACETGALRMVAPFDSPYFADTERELEDLFERMLARPRRALRTYGMIDYGDLMCSHVGTPAMLWEHFQDAPDVMERMKYCARSYNNEANDQLNALWNFYLHTGQRKYYLFAESYGEHMADVDIHHAGENTGLIHYHNASHFTGSPSPSHTTMAGLMLQYYLTGNRRLFDVCREIADWVLARQEPCGIFRNRHGTLVREYSSPLANLLEFYQATWERKYGDLARRSTKWMLLAQPEPGCFPQSLYTAGQHGDEAEVGQDGWHLRQAGGMTPQLLYDGVRLFGDRDPIYLQALLGMADQYVQGNEAQTIETLTVGPHEIKRIDPYFNAPLIAYAYEFTEKIEYAAFCRYYLREHFPRKAAEYSFTFVCWGSIIPPLMEAVRRAEAKYGTEALARAEQKWIEKVTANAGEMLTESGQPTRRSIGVIRGYDD